MLKTVCIEVPRKERRFNGVWPISVLKFKLKYSHILVYHIIYIYPCVYLSKTGR